MSPVRTRADSIKSVFIVSSGNFLEMYDFMVFGYYAKYIGQAFFPTGNELLSILLSLMTFGAGFLMRPIGAIVLGAFLDRHGRRKGLLLTLALMGLGTLSIACMPTYAQIGMAAPLLVLVGRLIQGLSAGVEVGGVSVYLSEIATPGNRGFYVAWQSGSQQIAVIIAALIGLVMSRSFAPDQISSWGWRIPFLIGSALIPFLFVIRRLLEETPEFAQRKERPDTRAILATIRANAAIVILGALMAVMTTVFFYMVTAYTPTYGNSILHLSTFNAMLVTLCVGMSNFVCLPLAGTLSDRVGRRPVLLVASVLAMLVGYPSLHFLAASPSFPRLLAVELLLAVIYAAYNGAMVVYLTEIMPVRVRTTGFSLAYSLATAIFGGFTPAFCTWLIVATGDRAIPGAWLSVAALISLLAITLLGRRERTPGSTSIKPAMPIVDAERTTTG